MPGQRGFTLIELMVALAVMAIVLGFAVPGFQSMVNGNRLAAASNELVAGVQTARMEAIRRGARVAICASANANAGAGATCATSGIDGWVVFVDADRSGAFNAGDTLLRNSTVDGNVEVSGMALASFRGDGIARDASGNPLGGNVRLRIDTTRPQQNVRCIAVSTGGNASITTPAAHDGACT
jgi:type IV fimbrial biogenesis protein FimT